MSTPTLTTDPVGASSLISGPCARIDLAALRHNLAVVRQFAPASKVMAVVKSLAYGHGVLPVVNALEPIVDGLAVARTNEAIQLRKLGVSVPLVVLEGPAQANELPLYVDHQLQAVVHQSHQIDWLAAFPGEAILVWLKLDTGMHRLGFAVDQAQVLIAQLKQLPAVQSVQVMTHLANADDRNDPVTHQQVQQLQAVADGSGLAVSVANSAGVLAWPESHADWVRPGLMLYGASPLQGTTAADWGLQPVMTLSAPLIAVNALRAGDRVGYGGTWTAPEAMSLGVVGIGYGDGYPRHIGSAAQVLINGVRVPVVGRVSMDMLTVDLRGVDAVPGDEVVLWGTGLPAEEVAGWADTIAYTLFCGVTSRVRRAYINAESHETAS